MTIRFVSFNIQHGLDYLHYLRVGQQTIDLELTANVVRDCGADIAGLNEVRGKGAHPDYTEQAEIIAGQLGFHCYFAKAIDCGGDGPYGNAIVSRFPIKRAETLMIPDPLVKDEEAYYETRCILKAELDVAGGLTVFVSHFGLARAERQNAVAEVARQIDQVPGPCVFMGDLNMTPDDPLLAPIYNRLADTAAVFSAPLLSFLSPNPERKIDYIFASRDIRVLSADIPAIVASDHRPHTAVLDIGAGRPTYPSVPGSGQTSM